MEENNHPSNLPEIPAEQPKPVAPIIQTQGSQSMSDQISMSLAKSISGWATFRAVLDIIVGGFGCLGGIFLLFMSLIFFASGSSINNSFSNYGNLKGLPSNIAFIYGISFLISGIIYPIVGVFVILGGAKLIRTVDHLKMAISANDDGMILDFLKSLSKFFKFNGIASIIKVSMTIVAIVLMIIMIVVSISSNTPMGSDFGKIY